MRLRSKSAVTCTRAWPGPTTEFDDAHDLLAQPPLERDLAILGALRGKRAVVAGTVGEQLAAFVDHGNAVGLEAVDGARHQVADGAHLAGAQRAAHLEHDGGRRLRPVAREQLALRQHQVHARGFDLVEAADGARELAFERPQPVDVLDEAGGAEGVGLVEDLVADAAALGQAVLGERHAQAGDLGVRHHDDGTAVLELVIDALAVELLQDRCRIVEREVGEQRHHLGCRHAHHEEGEEADQGQRDRDHGAETRSTQRLHKIEETLHRLLASPRADATSGADPARFAHLMVSVRLTLGRTKRKRLRPGEKLPVCRARGGDRNLR